MPCWREETVLSPSGDVEGDKTRKFQEERESNIGLCGVGQTVWGCCCNQMLAWLLNNRHLFTWLQTSTRSQGKLAGLGKREMAWSTGNEAIYARYIATIRHGQIYDNAFFPSVFSGCDAQWADAKKRNGGWGIGPIMNPSLTSLASRLSTLSGSLRADWCFLHVQETDGWATIHGWKPDEKPFTKL